MRAQAISVVVMGLTAIAVAAPLTRELASGTVKEAGGRNHVEHGNAKGQDQPAGGKATGEEVKKRGYSSYGEYSL